MAIEFVCAHCSKPYRVKDELAGKAAKCGQCGERMQIPQPSNGRTAHPASSQPAAGQAAARRPADAKPAAASTAAQKAPQRPSSSRTPQTRSPAPEKKSVASAAGSSATSSWLDDELLGAPAAQSQTGLSQTGLLEIACPKCGKRQPPGGVICGGCGEMLPAEATASNRPVLLKPLPAKSSEPPTKKRKRKRKLKLDMDAMAGLIKGTAFCIGFTMMASAIWAGVAFVTQMEFGMIAIGLGGLAGYGMALGHDGDNGLLAGIIAGFIAFCGIIAAKILIVVFVVAAFVAGAVGNLQREIVIQGMADEIIQQQGGNPANVSLDQRERAVKTARQAVEAMDDDQVEAQFKELGARWEADAAAAEAAEENVEGEPGAAPADAVAEDEPPPPAEEEPAPIVFENAMAADPPAADNGPGFGGLFRPLDLLFILLAVGTAFKVGSGMGE